MVLDSSMPQTFVVVSSDPDGDPLTSRWCVDGAAVGSSSPTYEFLQNRPATYVVRVVVSDGSATADFVWSVAVRVRTPTPIATSTVEFLWFLVIIAGIAAGFAAVGIARGWRASPS